MGLDLLRQRRSVRKYESRPVEREKLEAIIDAARFAPTGANEQPWEFVVVTDTKQLQKLADLTDKIFLANASACVAVFCRDIKYYLEDGCAVTTYILLAASVLGIGSCWIAGDKKNYADDVRKLLGVPEGYSLISIVALGYPASSNLQVKKRELAEIIHWEKF